MRWGRLAALAAVLFIIISIVRAPAALVVSVLPPTLTIAGVSGTIWSGQTANLSVSLGDQRLALGQTRWQINPLKLLTGGAIKLTTGWGSQRAQATIDLGLDGSLTITDSSLKLDVGWLRRVIPLYVAGVIDADIERMTFSSNAVNDVTGRLVWTDAAWRSNGGDILLGTYAVDMSTSDDGVLGEVITLKGALNVTGSVQIKDSEYELSLDLTGPAVRNEAFQQSIALMATPSGAGYQIALTGTL
jgi:general secretion pathway protein N|tara:strand:+ start:10594 stop:11328 length:735 start_codon:yes stop_codon:yes gene_type:complete